MYKIKNISFFAKFFSSSKNTQPKNFSFFSSRMQTIPIETENQQEPITNELMNKLNITFDKSKIMKEGKAEFYLSSIKTNEKGEKFQSDVFYNPVQVLKTRSY
jgi:hypothetical protein